MTQGTWQTPLGEVQIDSDLAGNRVSFKAFSRDTWPMSSSMPLKFNYRFSSTLPDVKNRSLSWLLATPRYQANGN